MKAYSYPLIVIVMLTLGISLAACTPPEGPCTFTANQAIEARRLPDHGSDQFGVMGAGETFEALAWTADGWVGFDPGVAQAGNQGLARHRWIFLNATVSPSCLAVVDLVTLADVQADVDLSGS